MSGLTVLAVPHFFQAGQSRTSFARTAVDVHRHGPASARTDDHLGLMLIELGLGDTDGPGEIFVRQFWVEDFVAVRGEVRRLYAARDRLPAVEEENTHRLSRTSFA